MNWFRQMFCKHDIQSKENSVMKPITRGGYVWNVEHIITVIFCKKCGYTKKVVV
jgi:hypothetical protein